MNSIAMAGLLSGLLISSAAQSRDGLTHARVETIVVTAIPPNWTEAQRVKNACKVAKDLDAELTRIDGDLLHTKMPKVRAFAIIIKADVCR